MSDETSTLSVWESQGFDPKVEEVLTPGDTSRVAIIRTSDRILFKRCRRRWGWQSHLRKGLQSKGSITPLWFGSGMHFALEDFHGYNVYGSPDKAILAYCEATKKAQQIPSWDFDEHVKLGEEMMKYYSEQWLRNRPKLETHVVDGLPQCEVNVHIEIPRDRLPPWIWEHYDKVIYSATLDRVIQDEFGELWIVEYKSAKRIATMHYQTDPQVGAYIWIGNALYGRPIAGVIYQQHKKDIPERPRILANGQISVNKQQATSHALYRDTLTKLLGADSNRWPGNYVEHLNYLSSQETQDYDNFIRRDKISRNAYSVETEGVKILMEIEDMLNPDLPMYPNPIRECAFQCPFLGTCVSMDDGSDYEYELKELYEARPQERDLWRQHLPHPSTQLPAKQLFLQQ